MTDAVVLLAIAQLVCLGAVAYLHTRLAGLQRQVARLRTPAVEQPSARRQGRLPELGAAGPDGAADLATLAARMHELGLDVPALARRMHRSEDEVRALLLRHGVQG